MASARIVTAVTLVALGSLAVAPVLAEWPAPAHDDRNTGVTTESVGADGPVVELWRHTTDGTVVGTPVSTAGGAVLVAVDQGQGAGSRIVALDGSNGSLRWSRTFSSRISGPPRFHRGLVYVGTSSGDLHALAASNGSEVDVADLGGPIRSRAVVTERALMVVTASGSGPARMDADARDPAIRVVGHAPAREPPWWNTTVPGRLAGPPAAADGRLYVPTMDAVTVLDAVDGRIVRRLDRLSRITTGAVVRNGTAFVGTAAGFRSVDLDTGTARWTAGDLTPTGPTVAVTSRDAFAVDDGDLVSVRRSDGHERWRRAHGAGTASVASVGPEHIYVGSGSEDHLIVTAVDRETGSETWRHSVEGSAPSTATPPRAVPLDGSVVVVAPGGVVAALGTEDGGADATADPENQGGLPYRPFDTDSLDLDGDMPSEDRPEPRGNDDRDDASSLDTEDAIMILPLVTGVIISIALAVWYRRRFGIELR